jgi:class 3 adenylate cyclase/tetratricopeptide (TPR) repeat protein/ABC-type transport system involved in cytochrome c biogenesis ATPase subunit
MPDVFLSYKRENAAAAERLVEGLRSAGFDVWWDVDIPPDAPWESTIERALADAKVVMVCWSKAAVASDNVRSEARWAREQGRLIQVFVEPCHPPLFFGERQGVELSDWSGDGVDPRFARLVSHIQGRLNDTAGVASSEDARRRSTGGTGSQTAETTLARWLKSMDLEKYAAAFQAADVSMESLPHLNDTDLKEIGVPLGPRRRILAAIAAGPAEAERQASAAPAGGMETTGGETTGGETTAAERRQITVMVVDLFDFKRLSADVDPEELADLLKVARDRVSREITAAGGRVAKSMGDSLLAYFGWPQAREDAAECAIRTGFKVIAEIGGLRSPDGVSLRSRIGIATGLCVIGEEGDGAARAVAIAGEAPNLAAGLQLLASPGAILVSDSTHRQIGRLFECENLGEQTVNGFSTPVRAWRPLRETAHLSRFKAARAVRTSFVGRDPELSLLTDRWETASEGTGRAVLIFGEAGMGKSRLAEALHDKIEEPHEFITWQCSPYHQTKALYPAIEYVTLAAGIVDADAPAEQLRKLTELLKAARGSLDDAVALFAQLLAIAPQAGFTPPALSPNESRTATIATLAEWIRLLAAERPVLLLLEDAHWIDATTLELLTRLVDSAGDVRLLVVITARPAFASPWSGRAEISTIGLDRLNKRSCEGLVRQIAGAASLENRTVEEIIARSDGNPLFVEELSAAVFETKTSSAQGVPDSLQSSLMARLDQLGDAKRTAQVCSVLGRHFARPLLSYVVGLTPAFLDANLSLLVERNIIRPIGGGGDGRYEFKHALVRDAAYESMLLSHRRRLHEACARSLEQSFPEVARVEPELLAQHFSLAGLAREASAYAEQAGDLATAACAYVEAIANYEDALRQNGLLPEGQERDRLALGLLLKLGPAIGMVRGAQDPELRDIYSRAERLSRTVGDPDDLFKAVWGLWYNANIARELDNAAAFAQELVVIGAESGDEDLALEALHCRWSSAMFRGDSRGCSIDAQRGTELYDKSRHHKLGFIFGGHDPGVCALVCDGIALICQGHVDRGLRAVDAAIALAEELDHPGSLAHSFMPALASTTIIRSFALVRAHAVRTLEVARKFNLPPQQTVATYHLAWLEAETGDLADGLRRMEAIYDRVTKTGPYILLYKAMYVEQLLKSGQTREALAMADDAITHLRFPDMGFALPELFRVSGDCLAALGRRDEAVVQLTKAEAMAMRDGAGLFRLRAAASLYRADAGERSHKALTEALAAFPSDWAGPDVTAARALLAV